MDRVAAYEENNFFFKGGIYLTLYWWFWFAPAQDRRLRNRRIILAAIIGAVVALAVNRIAAAALPFRVRPMYTSDSGYHAPSIAFPMNLEAWSSFPSDSATFWFALSFGLFLLNRWLGVAAMAHSGFWMCLVRLYLGIHYPSDVLAGAALGIGTVWSVEWLATRQETLARHAMDWLSGAERNHAQWFYAVAFLVSFELTMIFDDARDFVRAVMHLLRVAGYLGVNEAVTFLIVGGGLLLLVLAAASGFMLWRRRPPGTAQPRSSVLDRP